jgi:hypothetical protein
LVAATGIAAATGLAALDGDIAAIAASAMSRGAVMATTGGVSIHSDALASSFQKDPNGTVKALQARFPGLTADQVSVGAGGMVTFKTMNSSAFNRKLTAADNGSCGNILCSSLRLPNGGAVENHM